MKRFCKIFVIGLFLFPNTATSSHVNGGDITVTHISNYDFLIRLNVYSDTSVSAILANTQQVNFYERGSGTTPPLNVGSFSLNRLFDSLIQPRTPGCQNTVIPLARHYYEALVTLNPTVYNDPSGYLVVWQYCCRNGNILNIQSSGSEGQTIMTLIPPIADGIGNPIVNSSPELKLPISEYVCTQQLFKMEFGGTDPDGDSLAYAMYTIKDDGAFSGGLVQGVHAPYADPLTMIGGVTWASTYSASDAIHGASGPPDPAYDRLRVNPNTGMLTVRPRIPGIHGFGLWIKEFRDLGGNGTMDLIGSTYRDFLLPVIHNCPIPDILDKPIGFDYLGNTHQSGDTFYIPGNPAQRDITFKVWDKDYDPLDPVGHVATFYVAGRNFPDRYISLDPAQYVFSSAFDTVDVKVTFEPCARSGSAPYDFRFITQKGHCPVPYHDSLAYFAIVDSMFCNEDYFEVNGKVTLDGVIDPGISGEVFLFEAQTSPAVGWNIVDYALINQGTYTFDSTPPGDYYIQALLFPQDPNYANYIPSYFQSEIHWTTAQTLTLSSDTSGIDISLVPVAGTSSGTNQIIGNVIEGTKIRDEGDPIEDLQVHLLGPNNTPLAWDQTDQGGFFNFSSLLDGTYMVRVEVPGIPHSGELVTLSPQSTGRYLKFIVNWNSVVLSALTAQQLEMGIEFFPNPVNDRLYIRKDANLDEDVQIEILDPLGKVHFHSLMSENFLQIDMTQMPSGMYLLNIRSGKENSTQKIIKE